MNDVPKNFFRTVNLKSNFTTITVRGRIYTASIVMKYIFKALRINKSGKKNMLILPIKFQSAERKLDYRKILTAFLQKNMSVKNQNLIRRVSPWQK